jgi:hypothetical protein
LRGVPVTLVDRFRREGLVIGRGKLLGFKGSSQHHLAERSCDGSSTSEVRSSRSIRDAFAWSSVGGVS